MNLSTGDKKVFEEIQLPFMGKKTFTNQEQREPVNWLQVTYREPTVNGVLDGKRLDSCTHTNYKGRNKNCPCLQMNTENVQKT